MPPNLQKGDNSEARQIVEAAKAAGLIQDAPVHVKFHRHQNGPVVDQLGGPNGQNGQKGLSTDP
jgi:hypothetical protein